jgi:hypothetical protein
MSLRTRLDIEPPATYTEPVLSGNQAHQLGPSNNLSIRDLTIRTRRQTAADGPQAMQNSGRCRQVAHASVHAQDLLVRPDGFGS